MSYSKEKAEALPSGVLAASALACLLAGFFLTLLTRPVEALAASRPNFVVIQTDDQTLASVRALYQSRNGAMRKVMPNAKRLLRQRGFEFTRAHTASPLCAPSRASLLTGQYSHNNGLTRNGGESGGWKNWEATPIRENNLAVALKRDGYRTIQVGKFTNDYRGRPGNGFQTGIPPGWSRWLVPTERSHDGFDRTRYFRYHLNVQGSVNGPLGQRSTERDDCWFGPGTAPTGRRVCGHLTDRTTYLASREVERSRKPFFLSVSYSTPHVEHLGTGIGAQGRIGPAPSVRHEGTAKGTPLPRPPSFNEADMSDKPEFIRDYAWRRLGKGKIRNTTKYYRRYLESLRGVDDGIGSLVSGLRKSGELGNTFIFFTSDNGLFFGEHRFQPSKFIPYEPTIRVPLLVRGPGVPSGEKSRAPVSLIDVAPTIARLAGVNLDYEVDGIYLRPFWRDSDRVSDRPVLFELGELARGGGATSLRRAPYRPSAGIRVGRWKYIRYGGDEFELYDLKEDPAELRNLSADPRYSEVTDDLRRALLRYEGCAGDECREPIPIPPLPPLPPIP